MSTYRNVAENTLLINVACIILDARKVRKTQKIAAAMSEPAPARLHAMKINRNLSKAIQLYVQRKREMMGRYLYVGTSEGR